MKLSVKMKAFLVTAIFILVMVLPITVTLIREYWPKHTVTNTTLPTADTVKK